MPKKEIEPRAGDHVADHILEGLRAGQDRTPRQHLGCSILGRECEREIWYTWRWCSDTVHPGRLIRLFRRGQLEEEQVVADLRAIGIEVHDHDSTTGEQFRVTDFGGHLGGSLDGAVANVPGYGPTWMVLEIKTANAKSFRDLQRKGVKESKPEHFAQMQLYMRKTGMGGALYVAVCKDDDQIHTEVVQLDKAFADELLAKAERILRSAEPPAKISESPAWYKCKFCDHRAHCHGEDAPRASCRSCVHATPELDGDFPLRWKCELRNEYRTHAEQIAGCDQHLYVPGLLAFADVIDADPDGAWIAYKSEQGVHFKNGLADKHTPDDPAPWPSQAIEQLGAKVLTDDPLLESIRRNFGPIRIENPEQ